MKKKHKKIDASIPSGSKTGKSVKIFLLVVLGIIVFSLFYNQFVTQNKLSDYISPYQRWGHIENYNTWADQNRGKIWNSADAFFKNLMIYMLIIFILIELKKKFLQNYIRDTKFSDRKIIFYIVIAGAVILRSYIASGNNFYSGDSSYFIYLSWLSYAFMLKAKIIQFWHYFGSGGCNFNQFYGFIYNGFTGALNILVSNFHFSVKLSNLILRIIMSIGVFLYVKELTNNRKAAFISAMACFLIHHVNHAVLYLGRYSTVAGLCFAPYIFYFLERYINKQNIKYLAFMSLFIAVMIFTHMGGVYWMLLSFGLYFAIRVFLLKQGVIKNLSLVSFFSLIGVIITLPFILGYLFESKFSGWYLMFKSTGGADTSIDKLDSSLFSYLNWSNYRFNLFNNTVNTWQIGYMGLTLFILLVIVLIYFVRKKVNKEYSALILVSGMIFIFFLGFKFFFALFRLLSPIYLYGLSRFMILYVFYLSAMAGIGYIVIKDALKNKNEIRIFLIVLFVIFLDLFPTTFQDAFTSSYGGSARPIIDMLKNNYSCVKNKKLADFNIVLCAERNGNADGNWRTYNSWLVETEGVPNISGHLVDRSLKIHFFQQSLNEKLNMYLKNFNNIALPDYVMNGLDFFNVKYLIAPNTVNKEQFKKVYECYDLTLCELSNNSPAYASLKINKMASSNIVKNDFFITNDLPYLKGLNIDKNYHTINQILVSDETNINLPEIQLNPGVKLKLNVLTNYITVDHVNLTINVNNDCYARFAFSNYPNMGVRINGKKVRHYETIEGMILVKLQKGTNRIEIIPHLSKLREGLSYFSILLVLILLLIIASKSSMFFGFLSRWNPSKLKEPSSDIPQENKQQDIKS